jgi:ABC-type transport system substrate-binding protein
VRNDKRSGSRNDAGGDDPDHGQSALDRGGAEIRRYQKMGDVSSPPGSIGWPADPLFSMSGIALPLMIEPLVDIDLKGVMQPRLATKWDIAPDLKSVTMTLRQGVKFHDGSDFNTDVARWNIDQMVVG